MLHIRRDSPSGFWARSSAGTLSVFGLLTATASAQTPPPPQPPDVMMVSPTGVDLRSGLFQVNKTLLSIGDPGDGGIDFRRLPRTYGHSESPGRMAQFNHNWDIEFKERRAGNTYYIDVRSDTLSFTFPKPTGSYTETAISNTSHAKLTRVGSGSSYYYSMQVSGGTTIVSRTIGTNGRALAASMTLPNQVKYTLSYDLLGPSGAARLRNVTSNRGYALFLEYHPNSGSNFFVSKACVINLTQATLPASCPVGASSVAYGYTGSVMTSETDPSGAVWNFGSTYTGSPNAFQESFRKPGEALPYMTLNYSFAYDSYTPVVELQSFADGRSITYYWSSAEYDPVDRNPVTSGYRENSGAITVVRIGAHRPIFTLPLTYTPGPESVKDPIGRTTTFQYCVNAPCLGPNYRLHSKTYPDGQKEYFTYDGSRNVTQVTKVSAPGSGLPSITTSATYSCANMIVCNRPTSITDSNGNVYTFTYDPTHGGVLTETRPAVQVSGSGSAVAPVIRYEYAARNAWISNGSGGYTPNPAPIYVLVAERTCRTSATVSGACAAGATDEVVTTYDYGPNAGPNNLLVRGKLVTASDGGTTTSLRTCYGYDKMGRQIWATEPRADLASCS